MRLTSSISHSQAVMRPGGNQVACSRDSAHFAIWILKGVTLRKSRRLWSTCCVSGMVLDIVNIPLRLFFIIPFQISFVTLTLQMRKCRVKWLAQHYVAGR